MDDIKLLTKNEKELEILIQAVRKYNDDIGMELGSEKYAMLIMKRGKRQITEPNQEKKLECLEKRKYWKQTLLNKLR